MPNKKRSSPPVKKANRLKENLSRTLLQYVQGKRYEPMSPEELHEELSIAPVHTELFHELVQELIAHKQLSLVRGRVSMAAAAAQLATGTISVHPKGFAFVKTGDGPDVFIPKHLVRDAVDGDLVEVDVASEVSAKGPEGAVVSIIKRSRTHLAGTVVEVLEKNYKVYAPLLGKEKSVLVRSKTPLEVGDRIICKVVKWQTDRESVEGELTRRFGHISDPLIDIDAAIEEFELPTSFTQETLEEAKAYGKKVTNKDVAERLDLTEDETVTIDPDTAKDYDDAISLTLDEKGHFHLGVHIADVAHYVKAGSHLDRDAYLRSNSTYFPGRCVPMLPEELSNELCSLKANVKRLTMSVLAEFDPKGNLISHKITRSIIKSQKRFTYKEALEVIEGRKKSVHAPLLQRMVTLCHLLKKKRFDRGSIEFSMPDNVLIINEKGMPEGMERVEYDITHQMIEEFMLKANELVALHLSKHTQQLIYRIHEAPTPESFEEFYTFARSMGFQVPPNPNSQDIQELFHKAKDSPLLPQLSIRFIRSMRLAQYSADNIGHYGLALEHYCHFTSPIRRYTDLIIQRLLTNELPEGFDLPAAALACSTKERLSFKAESSVVTLKKLRLANLHFQDDPTRIYRAIITRIKPFALFFEVPDFDIEGTLHISEIGNDYYEFNPRTLTMRGSRTGKTYTSGQQIDVRIDKIDFILQENKWSLIGPPREPRPKRS
jgi:ribonuclease R